MKKTPRRPVARVGEPAPSPTPTASRAPAPTRVRKPPKRPTNLTLDPEAVARGERFSARHGTSLSQLVTRFLHALPADEGAEQPLAKRALTPPVRRLHGIVAGGGTDRDAYRARLVEKYGGR